MAWVVEAQVAQSALPGAIGRIPAGPGSSRRRWAISTGRSSETKGSAAVSISRAAGTRTAT